MAIGGRSGGDLGFSSGVTVWDTFGGRGGGVRLDRDYDLGAEFFLAVTLRDCSQLGLVP